MSRAWNPESRVIRCSPGSGGSRVTTDLLQVTTSAAYLVQGIFVSTESNQVRSTSWADYALVYRNSSNTITHDMMIFNGPGGPTDNISDKTPYFSTVPVGNSTNSNYARVIVSKDNAFFHTTLDWKLSIANQSPYNLDVLITYVLFKGVNNNSTSGTLWTY